MISAEVLGFNALADALLNSAPGIMPGVNEEIWEWAQRIRDKSKSLAAVLTGRMRREIRVEREFMTFRLVSPVPYAGFQEFGTSRMRAQPYLWPAIHMLLPDMVDAVRDRVVHDFTEMLRQ